MKKRLLSAFLALTMLATMVVMPVNAQEETAQDNVTAPTELCSCGCETPLNQVQWKPYDANVEKSLTQGHYYLADDYVHSQQITVLADHHVVLDLRGHTLSTSYSGRLYLIYGYLHVLDTAGGGKMMSKTSGTGVGGVIMLSINEVNESLLEMRSGTLMQDPTGNNSLRGGLIYLGQHCTFRMYNGVLTGGKTHTYGESSVYGGAIAATAATSKIEILGGTIMDCSAATAGGSIYSAGTTILKNCKILGGTAGTNGGNIYQKGGSLTMENCEIAYGTANGTSGGGNVYVTGSAVFTDNGSTIRDGASMGGSGSGGNLLLAAGTHTLTDTTIRGGVSQQYGANVANWSETATRLIDCNIDGDVRWSGAGLSLEGKTRIGLRSNGLNLVGSSAGSVISASKLTDGAEVFVSAHWGVFTNDDANLDYFKPALRTVLSKNDDGTLSGSSVASGAQGGYCPHCYDPANPQKVIWQAYTAKTDSNITESGHYYLSEAVTARLNIMADTDVVIDLNGKNITSGHRALVLKAGATLSLLDFNGAAKVTGKGGKNWAGGVIYGEGACNLNIYGGTYTYTPKADHTGKGGVIYAPAGSNVNIYGGSFDASAYNNTAEGYVGGVIAMADSATSFTMSAGRVIGGNAYQGGAVFCGKSTSVEITGGMISGGTAVDGGGNVRFLGDAKGKGTAKLQDCAVVGGTAVGNSGGNMHVYYYKLDMDNCYILNGVNEAGTAGNLNSSTGAVTVASNTIIANGRAQRGGNVYAGSTVTNVTFKQCVITGGEAILPASGAAGSSGCGGNIYGNNGRVVVIGGEISHGKAAAAGGNLYLHMGNVSTDTYPDAEDDTAIFGDDLEQDIGSVQILAGTAGTSGGNVYVDGKAELNAAYIAGGRAVKAGKDIYLYKGTNTALTLGKGLSGQIQMETSTSLLGEGIYGQPVATVKTENFDARIIMTHVEGQPDGLPSGGKLYIPGASVVDSDGKETWHVDNASAVADCGKNQYVKLYAGGDLVLTRDLTVDINGQTVAVSGEYALAGMDSSGDGYTLPTGKVTVTGAVADITRAPNHNLYLPVIDGNSFTFHRLGMALTDIALRPEAAGIYYQATWSCDDVLKSMIDEYGIVTSLAGMPDENFRSDDSCMRATFEGAIENGTKQASVLVEGIMKTDNETQRNADNGQIPIYATAYVTLTDGTTFVSDAPEVEDDISYSLYDFMSYLDTQIVTDPTHFRRLEKQTKEFYAAWEDKGMGDWEFNRLKAPQDPADDNEFNVIMIGSSYTCYYVQELYALLVEAGYEKVNVCNVYYSGCMLSQTYNWWMRNEANHVFYEVSSSAGRVTLSRATTLEACLARHNWDVISMQEAGASTIKKIGAQKHYENTMLYHSTLLPYLEKEFPQARHMWHSPWVYEVGADRNGLKIPNLAEQHNLFLERRKFDLLINDQYPNYERVPTGEAWQVMREKHDYFQLCARLGAGTPLHYGDDSHDGDIGGGQLLNACVWYEIITGKDCTQTEFVPEYTYDGKVMENLFDAELIKSAAHEAVQAMKAGGCAISLDPMPVE